MAYFFDSLLAEHLIYQRNEISNGELWRMLTGHFFHTNTYHLLLNLAALVLLWALHGHFYSIKNYLGLFLFSAIICSIGLYFYSPQLIQYVGLSGALHGVFCFGALFDIKTHDKTGYLLFLGLWVKIIHEQIYGASEDVSNLIGANVAIDAHLWGAIGGLVFFVIYIVKHTAKKKNKKQPTLDE